MFRSFYIIVTLIISASSTVIAQQPFPDSIKSGLSRVVEEFKNEIHAPGIAVAMFQDTTIIFGHASGFTDSGMRVPVTIDSKFPIMSITKMFTSTLLMQLVEQKKVHLEDPVKKYVPEYPISERLGPVRAGNSYFRITT